jgi:hypothetical protein
LESGRRDTVEAAEGDFWLQADRRKREEKIRRKDNAVTRRCAEIRREEGREESEREKPIWRSAFPGRRAGWFAFSMEWRKTSGLKP